MHLSSLQLVPLCEKQADGMDQEEGIQEFSLSVLTCFVCLLVVDNTSDFQATIIPLYQVVELQN